MQNISVRKKEMGANFNRRKEDVFCFSSRTCTLANEFSICMRIKSWHEVVDPGRVFDFPTP